MKIPVILACALITIILAAGCTHQGSVSPGPATIAPVPATTSTIPAAPVLEDSAAAGTPVADRAALQPSATPDADISSYIRMESDSFVPGEVASFHIYNRGPGNLLCKTQDPSYAIFGMQENGTWNRQSIAFIRSNRTEELVLGVGDSTHEYRFVTAGWKPGQYQLVVNCETGGRNLFHAFQLKPIPMVMVFN